MADRIFGVNARINPSSEGEGSMAYKILVINPGSTSTKIAVFEDEAKVFEETIRHSSDDIHKYGVIFEQYEFRKEIIIDELNKRSFDLKTLDAVVGRGGAMKPVEGGVYAVNQAMLDDLEHRPLVQHASNLGAAIASEIAKPLGIPAFIVDPVVVDELEDIARISGIPQIERKPSFHALNQKAVAKKYASEVGKDYAELKLLIAHMGGGVTVGAHKYGRVVDVSHGSYEGPFTPERAGELPTADLINLYNSGEYSLSEIHKLLLGKGGMVAYLGTNDVKEVEKRALAGDGKAKLILDAFIYQIAKEIGKYSVVLCGEVDAIILTGGVAYSKYVTDNLSRMTSFIGPVVIYPGENELLAMAQGALRVLKGDEKSKEYK